MKYKFLSHTADVKFQAYGNSIAETYKNSVYALKETICGKIKVKPKIKKIIAVNGKDNESLLYNFLEEFLFLLDSEGYLVTEVSNIFINPVNGKGGKLKAEVYGDKIEDYKISNSVKAVTYNDMFIRFDVKTKMWISQVVLDV